ncbi:hypothetical protein BC941DRAFT_448037 [Chlamydoabsidia padenii]|nr:hypothetical protein BC941DRAFT_448037 [Chlamydoabsidia padenii]
MNSSQLTDKTSPPYAHTPWWGARLVDNAIAAVLKPKKKLTISLKNTILWNPSQDATVSNHAFHENALSLLTRLCQRYHVYLLIHTNNDNDRDQIQRLLAPVERFLDPSHFIYCQDEQQKIDLIQNVIRPAIHVEGGWELDDGEDIVRALSSVQKLVWVITRRRRTSFNEENIKPKDKDLVHEAVELTDSLLDSSLAQEAGFIID